MMDNELKSLKAHLNRTVYRGQHFTEKHKMDIRSRIHQTKEMPQYNRLKSVLGVAVCFAMLIALGTFVWKQMSTPNTITPLSQGESQQQGETSTANTKIEPFAFVYVQHSEKNVLDSVMVVAVNPNKKSAMLLSLPPNYQVKPGNYGVAEDLQGAFSKSHLSETIAKVFNIPIQNVIDMTDQSFKQVVDLVGGIKVNSPFAFQYMGESIDKGTLRLDGNEALAYFTMLKSDPKGEMGRMNRQEAIVKELLQRVSISTLKNDVLSHKRMNDLSPLVGNVVKSQKANNYQFKSLTLRLNTKTEDAIFYYVADQKNILAVTTQLKAQLQR